MKWFVSLVTTQNLLLPFKVSKPPAATHSSDVCMKRKGISILFNLIVTDRPYLLLFAHAYRYQLCRILIGDFVPDVWMFNLGHLPLTMLHSLVIPSSQTGRGHSNQLPAPPDEGGGPPSRNLFLPDRGRRQPRQPVCKNVPSGVLGWLQDLLAVGSEHCTRFGQY